MGAERFDHYQNGTEDKRAFAAAVEKAGWDYGHSGYTGSIAEKHEFEIRNGGVALTLKDAQEFADKDLDENDHDKWGPAWAVKVRADDSEQVIGFLFYGYASS
jgi:hypothetical protein